MKIVKSPSGKILAKHIVQEDIRDGLGFFSDDSDFIQVGTWRYEEGKDLLAHQHNLVQRTVERTQEVLVIQKGAIQASIFDENEEHTLLERFDVKQGEVLILLHGAHGYKILEDGTQVVEIKNGPYLGAEIDRVRI